MEPTSFESLSVYNWRQFKKVDLKLHRKLTVITGANGAGKTTLLNMFSEHFGWGRALLATPIAKKDGTFGYVAGVLARLSSLLTQRPESGTAIGEILY